MNLMKQSSSGGKTKALAQAKPASTPFRSRVEGVLARDPWQALEEMEAEPWPAIDVVENDKSFSVRFDVPGLSPKDLDVEVSGSLLTVRGSRKEEHEEKDGGYYRHERFSGSFSRCVNLPSSVDPSQVEARYDKGVLTVTASKLPGQQAKKVAVQP